jgi:hypothetical protein
LIGDAPLRRTARYNLGVAYLRRGLRQDGEARTAAMKAAQRAFRTVLLETPGDRNAQWNYELAMRSPEGGGGGRNRPQQGPPPPESQPQGQMTRQQAEALLDASAREERDVQARRRRGEGQGRATGERDW